MSGVRTLPPPCLEQLALAADLEQSREQELFGTAHNQAGTKLTQDRVVKPGIGELQIQRVLPINPTAHRIGGLPIG
jgi:hypothetical protein